MLGWVKTETAAITLKLPVWSEVIQNRFQRLSLVLRLRFPLYFSAHQSTKHEQHSGPAGAIYASSSALLSVQLLFLGWGHRIVATSPKRVHRSPCHVKFGVHVSLIEEQNDLPKGPDLCGRSFWPLFMQDAACHESINDLLYPFLTAPKGRTRVESLRTLKLLGRGRDCQADFFDAMPAVGRHPAQVFFSAVFGRSFRSLVGSGLKHHSVLNAASDVQ